MDKSIRVPGRITHALRTPRRRWSAVGLLAVVVLVGVFAILEGDLPEAFGDGVRFTGQALHRFGDFGAFSLLYAEESGVPMPMPGDVFVMYAGHHAARSFLPLFAAWLTIIVVVVLGATNLFFLSRRYGRELVERRVARYLNIGPAQLRRAERWFERWGVLALIFGRHIPGLRVPLTVGAGLFKVRYPVFAASVAVSTAIWAGVFVIAGALVGGRVGHLLSLHRETYVLFPLAIFIAFAIYLGVVVRRLGREERVARTGPAVSPEPSSSSGSSPAPG